MEKRIHQYWKRLQLSLFASPENEIGPQTPKHRRLMVILDYLDLESSLPTPAFRGRKPYDRTALANSFVAKAVFNLPTTEALIDRLLIDRVLRRLCGFDLCRRLPCKATFSNAFAEFSELRIPDRIHDALIKAFYREGPAERIVGHISRDSTDIPARGKAIKVAKGLPRKPRAKGTRRRVVRQLGMSFEEMLNDLPRSFDCGSKRGHYWKGFKLHLDVGDAGIPISAIVTSASVHDSQVAIPLAEKTSRRVTSLYSLMDSAYDAREIRDFVSGKGKVAIIEPMNRQGETFPLDLAMRARYGERTTVERVYGRLKDDFGARQVRVRTPLKVEAHLMFGVVALAAEQIIRGFG